MRTKTIPGLALAGALLASPAASLASSYDEAIDGDLSGDRFAPTTVTLSDGSNLVRGTFGKSAQPDVADLDYLTVIVGPGSQLNALILVELNPGGANSFLGVQAGSTMTLAPTSFDPSPLLGWAHIYRNQEGLDLLPALALGAGLGPGSYTFWINETDTSEAWRYGLDFRVVPVPAAALTFLPALASLLWTRRRSSQLTKR